MREVSFSSDVFLVVISTEGNARRYGTVTITHHGTQESREYDITAGRIETVEFDRGATLTIETDDKKHYFFNFYESGEIVGDLYDSRTNDHIDTVANYDFVNP